MAVCASSRHGSRIDRGSGSMGRGLTDFGLVRGRPPYEVHHDSKRHSTIVCKSSVKAVESFYLSKRGHRRFQHRSVSVSPSCVISPVSADSQIRMVGVALLGAGIFAKMGSIALLSRRLRRLTHCRSSPARHRSLQQVLPKGGLLAVAIIGRRARREGEGADRRIPRRPRRGRQGAR